jgi:hypothetical protein
MNDGDSRGSVIVPADYAMDAVWKNVTVRGDNRRQRVAKECSCAHSNGI